MKKIGRPPTDTEKRTKLVAFYLTETEFQQLKRWADRGGFKSTSSMLTALVEPVIQGGLSLVSAAKAISRVQRFMEANGEKFSASMSQVKQGMLNIFTAPPPIIGDDMLDNSQLQADLRALLAELENQTNTTSNK